MPIDASIPLGVRAVQFENPQDIQARGLQIRALQRADSQAQDEEAAQKTIRDLYRANVDATGNLNAQGFVTGLAQAGLGDRIPQVQQQLAAQRKATSEADESDLNLHKKRLDMLSGGLASLLAKPNVTHDDVIGQINNFVNQGLITPQQGAEAARNTPGRPEQLRPFLVQRALEASDAAKRLDAILPKYNEQDRGGTINQGTIDPLTGTRTAGENIQKTATPGQVLSNDRIAFTQDEGNLMAALAEHGVSLPAGLRSREQMKSTFASLLSRNPNLSPDEIAEKVATGQINMGAEKKETTTAAGQAGKVAVAVNELATFGDQVLDASNAVPRGKFIPVTRLMQMTDAQLSDPALINLKTKMQALNNAYDQLAARGGTDAEKRAHIASLFNTATGPEGVAALVKAVKDEGAAAEEAARRATKRREPEGQKPAPGARPPLDAFNGGG